MFTQMAVSSGNPKLDSLLALFAAQPENEALADGDYAYGRCAEASERFYDFLAAHGFTDAGIDWNNGDPGAGIAPEVDHVWCWLRIPEGVFRVDWTAAQFARSPGFSPFPLLERRNEAGDWVELEPTPAAFLPEQGNGQRHWPRPARTSVLSMSAIAIVGPNGVGKTGVAYELARRLGGEVVNLDKVYLFDGFSLATGLADTEAQLGVTGHLYRLLAPEEPIIPAAEFARLVQAKVAEINGRGALAVLEGGSTSYLPPLFALNAREPFFAPVFALAFGGEGSRRPISRRVAAALAAGLLAEVRAGLAEHPDSLIMRDAHFVTPLLEHLRGECTLAEAEKKIVGLCLDYSERQLALLEAEPGLHWIRHERERPERTLALITAVLSDSPVFV